MKNSQKKIMKEIVKRMICLFLIFSISSFSVRDYQFESYAAEVNSSDLSDIERNNDFLCKKDAEKIALFQVKSTIDSGENGWKKGTKVKKVYELYNDSKEITSYAVELKLGKSDAGYVVVSATENCPPIIEFSTAGSFMKDVLKDNEYLIYDGSIDYYRAKENTNVAMNIKDNQREVSIKDVINKETKSLKRKKEIRNEWKTIRDNVNVENSIPPTAGSVNTNPLLYESGYNSVNYRLAPDAKHYTYHVMTEFGPGGICFPTAVCNLLKYYTDRKQMKTSLLLNNSWMDTFNRLNTYFNTNNMQLAKPGLDRYLQDVGIQDAVTHYYGYDGGADDVADWPEMKRRLDFGEPFVYIVTSHYVYGCHAVLAVGYLQYNYSEVQSSGLTSSNYLMIADGWTNKADRYVNVNVGTQSLQDQMLTLFFVYSYAHK